MNYKNYNSTLLCLNDLQLMLKIKCSFQLEYLSAQSVAQDMKIQQLTEELGDAHALMTASREGNNTDQV